MTSFMSSMTETLKTNATQFQFFFPYNLPSINHSVNQAPNVYHLVTLLALDEFFLIFCELKQNPEGIKVRFRVVFANPTVTRNQLTILQPPISCVNPVEFASHNWVTIYLAYPNP